MFLFIFLSLHQIICCKSRQISQRYLLNRKYFELNTFVLIYGDREALPPRASVRYPALGCAHTAGPEEMTSFLYFQYIPNLREEDNFLLRTISAGPNVSLVYRGSTVWTCTDYYD